MARRFIGRLLSVESDASVSPRGRARGGRQRPSHGPSSASGPGSQPRRSVLAAATVSWRAVAVPAAIPTSGAPITVPAITSEVTEIRIRSEVLRSELRSRPNRRRSRSQPRNSSIVVPSRCGRRMVPAPLQAQPFSNDSVRGDGSVRPGPSTLSRASAAGKAEPMDVVFDVGLAPPVAAAIPPLVARSTSPATDGQGHVTSGAFDAIGVTRTKVLRIREIRLYVDGAKPECRSHPCRLNAAYLHRRTEGAGRPGLSAGAPVTFGGDNEIEA